MAKLMEQVVDFTPVQELTVREVFGKKVRVKELTGKVWKLIKANNLIANGK